MSDIHPIHTFQQWYAAQPSEVRIDIAAFTLLCHPDGLRERQPLDSIVESEKAFGEWLDAEPDSPYRVVGRILHIRSIVDFILVRRFGDADDWEEKKAMHEDMIAEFKQQGNQALAQKLQDGLDHFPEREQMWREVSDSWRRFSNTSISLEVIEAWLDGEQRKRFMR